MNQRFSKSERLKGYSRIKSLFAEGEALKSYPIKMVFFPIDDECHKAGVSVSKRRFKKASDRNRIKRQMREAYRLNKHIISDTRPRNALMFIYLSPHKMEYEKIEKAIQHLLRQLTM